MNEDNDRWLFGGEDDSAPEVPAEPSWSYTPPREEAAPAAPTPEAPELPRRKARERRGMGAGAVIALCLVCAILAAAVSAGVTYFVTRDGGRTRLGEAIDSLVPSPVPVITTVTAETGAVNDTAAAIYALATQQVVGVRTDVTYYNIFGQSTAASVSGSGVILTEDGYILTNHHVVEDAIQGDLAVTIMMYDETSYAAEIVGYDADNDLALLKIDAAGLNAAQLGESDDLTVGQIIYAVGNPLGELNYSMTSGIVSATDRTITTESNVAMNVFQIDAAVNSGNSGGPVYNSLGQVIGIVSAKYSSTGVEGLGFAIPISDAAHIANQLLEYGYVKDKAWLGVTTATVTASIAQAYHMVEGAYVNAVTPGTSAEAAGLREGDIIVRLDGKTVAGSGELTSMLRQYHAGEEAVLTVYRDGSETDLTVVFDEKPREEPAADSSNNGRPQNGPGSPFSFGGTMDDFFRYFFDGFGF